MNETTSSSGDVSEERKQAQLLFLYEQLRNEILHNDNSMIQILVGCLIIVGTIIGFVFTDKIFDDEAAKAILLLVATVITVAATFQGVDRAHSTYRIAAFLKHFVEPELTYIKWETILNELRETPRYNPPGEFALAQLVTYAIVTVISSLLAWIFGLDALHIMGYTALQSYVFLSAISIILLAAWVYILRRYFKYVDDYVETYETLWGEKTLADYNK